MLEMFLMFSMLVCYCAAFCQLCTLNYRIVGLSSTPWLSPSHYGCSRSVKAHHNVMASRSGVML